MSNMENEPQIILFERLHKVGQFIGRVFGGPHLLASHGDHFVNPLDAPIEPVTDWPEGSDDGSTGAEELY